MSARRPAEQRMPNAARMHAAARDRAVRRSTAAARQAHLNSEWLAARVADESHRFGRPVPADPFILDMLANIDVTSTGEWLWRGVTNNQGTATCRYNNTASERTVVRVLAEAFGVVAPTDYGSLYPLGSRDDVNPFNRRLRRTTSPLGNPGRYNAQPEDAA